MPYLVSTHTAETSDTLMRSFDEERLRICKYDDALAQRGVTIKIVGSSFDDPGDDWTRHELYDADDNLISSITEPGW